MPRQPHPSPVLALADAIAHRVAWRFGLDANDVLDEILRLDFRTRRVAAGLTVKALASRIRVSETHLSNIERGRRTLSPGVAELLEAALGDP